MPDAFKAVSSLNSPIFPNVIREARRIASGSAVGTNESEKLKSSSLRIFRSRPFPANSSIYIQRNCKIRMMSTMKKVKMSGPIKDFNTNLSTCFTVLNLTANLLEFYEKSEE
jgi:hypothetical protein